jgi:hypothetical protein
MKKLKRLFGLYKPGLERETYRLDVVLPELGAQRGTAQFGEQIVATIGGGPLLLDAISCAVVNLHCSKSFFAGAGAALAGILLPAAGFG